MTDHNELRQRAEQLLPSFERTRRVLAEIDLDRWWFSPWLVVPVVLAVPTVLVLAWRSFHAKAE